MSAPENNTVCIGRTKKRKQLVPIHLAFCVENWVLIDSSFELDSAH